MQTRDWQVAQIRARDMEAAGPESQQTVIRACERFTADAKSRGLKDASIYKYKILFRQLQEFAVKQNIFKLSELTLEKTRLFRESWTNKGQSARKKLEFLRSFLRFCVDSGWIKTNPAKLIKLPIADDAQVLPFTQPEFDQILAACDRYPDKKNRIRTRALVLLMKNSGLRLGDAVTLARDRIKGGRLQLRTAKTGTQVAVPLAPDVLNALDKIPKETGHYFWTGKSTRKTVTNVWEETLRRLFDLSGVSGAHSHRLRHTFAVTLLERGASLESVSILLGHKDLKITQKHYSAWIQSRQESLEAEVRKTWTVAKV
jgi:integrase/recombinase XerD